MPGLTIKFEFLEDTFYIKLIANDTDVVYDFPRKYDGITLLLEAVTDLLPVVGDYDKYFKQLRTYSRCIHDSGYDSDIYQWDFKRINESVIQFIIRQNPDTEYEEELRLHDFENDEDFKQPDKDRLQFKLQAAFSVPINHFAYKLKVACDELLQQIPLTEYEQQIGYPFPEKLYNKLKTYCNYYPYGFP